MDESRKQFEEWYESWFGEAPISGWDEVRVFKGGYSPEIIDAMWQAWQASRQELQENQEEELWVKGFSTSEIIR